MWNDVDVSIGTSIIVKLRQQTLTFLLPSGMIEVLGYFKSYILTKVSEIDCPH